MAKDTTVIPMTILGICNLKDSATAAFSNQFPPNINATKPKKINKASNIVLIWSKYNKAPPKVLKKKQQTTLNAQFQIMYICYCTLETGVS